MPYPRRLLWDIPPRNTPNSQNLLQRCPPTDFSLGGYGILPYPRHLLWDILPQNTPNSQNLLLRCSPTEFTEFTEFGSVGMAGMPYPPTSVRIRAHLWEALLCKRFCAFRAFCGNLFPPTEFTEFGSVGMAGMPYPPTSVRICAICGRLFSARSFRAFCGNIFSPTDFTDLHRCLECAVLPQNSQNLQNLAAWVWQGCHTLLHL